MRLGGLSGRARRPFGATVGTGPLPAGVVSGRSRPRGVHGVGVHGVASSVEERQALVDKATAEVDAMSAKAGTELELERQQVGDFVATWRKSGADLGPSAHLT